MNSNVDLGGILSQDVKSDEMTLRLFSGVLTVLAS